jgi:C1A family cysteine protease
MKWLTAILLSVFLFQAASSGELHRTGALFSDPRSHPELTQVVSVRLASGASLLSWVDLSSQMPPVGNQGAQGSCVAWAMGYYHKTHTEWHEQGWDVSFPQNQFSPAFIYNQINGGADGGSYFNDAMKLIVDHGVASMALSPYKQTDDTTWPSDTAYSYAIRYRGATGYWIDCSNDAGLGLVKTQLNNGYTVVLGIYVWSNFDNIGTYGNKYCVANEYGTNRGGHGVTIVGYDDTVSTADGSGAFKLVNSWGTGWGAAGYFWMSYQAVKDGSLSQRYAYYVSDRIGYTPLFRTRIRISHAARTRVGIRFGFGPTGSPRGTKDFFNWIMPTQTNRSFPDNAMVFDLTDNVSSLGPDSMVFVRCIDNTSDALAGTINSFSAELAGSFTRMSIEPPVTIPDYNVYAYARLAPVFSVSSASLPYGKVPVGSGKQDSVTVTNTGTAPLTISSVVSNNPAFTVAPAGGSLTPSASRKFYITFSPSSSGAKSGSISFTHNAAASPDTVSVSGTGAFQITTGATGNGTITPSGTLIVDAHGSQQFTFSPSGGYCVDSVMADGTCADSTVSYTFYDVTGNHTIAVKFKSAVLPIQIASLRASVVNAGVQVEWTTVSEVNNYGFFIERRGGRDTAYATVSDLIPGAGTSLEEHHYSWTDTAVIDGTYRYRIRQTDLTGDLAYSGEIRIEVSGILAVQNAGAMPREYTLSQNYPNPFNPSTTLRYALPSESRVTLRILNTLGQEVARLVDGIEAPGYKSVLWDASHVASGIYFCRMDAASTSGQTFTEVHKMILIR